MSEAWPNRFPLLRDGVDPKAEALLCDGETWTYEALAAAASDRQSQLREAAAAPGDRIALLASPTPEGLPLIHGMLDAGLVMVPLNLRLTEGELCSAVMQVRVRFLIVSPETQASGQRIAQQAGIGLLLLQGEQLMTLRPAGPASPDRRAMLESGTALVLMTSGTSGRPKAAMLSLASLLASAEGSLALLGQQPGDRWLLCMPLFHIGGLSILTRSALAGTSVVLHRRFEAEEVARSLEQDRISQISVVATMLRRLLDVRDGRPSPETLRLVLLGGGPAAESLLEEAERLGYPLAPTYGLTEAASQVATRPPLPRGHPQHQPPDSINDRAAGLEPLPGTRLRIIGPLGTALPAGEVGEIEVAGPTLMSGYFEDPEATKEAMGTGWLRTGDLGCLDDAGGLRVFDRRSDLIISGGENVYPAEIESVLTAYPGVAEAAVVGRADPEFGARPVGFVVRAPSTSGQLPDQEEAAAIIDFCRLRLAGYKVPAELFFVDELPRTSSGKVLRRVLAARVES